jgi:hypothetical protein
MRIRGTPDNPTGAMMVQRTEKVKDRVAYILTQYPQTRGDDLQLVWRYYQLYTNVRIKFSDFKALLMCPAPETISRRRRELQESERKAVENGEILLSDTNYLPREKTIKKREDYRMATSHYYGKGMTLGDYL